MRSPTRSIVPWRSPALAHSVTSAPVPLAVWPLGFGEDLVHEWGLKVCGQGERHSQKHGEKKATPLPSRLAFPRQSLEGLSETSA